MRIAILSVHYSHIDFFRDQIERLALCLPPSRCRINYYPIYNCQASIPVASEIRTRELPWPGRSIYIDGDVGPMGYAHGYSLSRAFKDLYEHGDVSDEDFLLILDHDAHPLRKNFLVRMYKELIADQAYGGVGVPWWHGDFTFLHPSCALIRVSAVSSMGPVNAFEANPDWRIWDTFEKYSILCSQMNYTQKYFKVYSTTFPWKSWNRVKVPDCGITLTGNHGEFVRIGNHMIYGFADGSPLISHLWMLTYKDRAETALIERYLEDEFV